jgi:hypothetical protein
MSKTEGAKLNSLKKVFVAPLNHQQSNNQQSADTCMMDCALLCEGSKE